MTLMPLRGMRDGIYTFTKERYFLSGEVEPFF